MPYNPHAYVRVWEGRPFVHAWLGRIARETSVRANKQSDHSPGGGGLSTQVWLIPCVLHLWVLLLYVVTTLALVEHGMSPRSLLWEIPAAIPYFCIPIITFFFIYKQAKLEESPHPPKRKNDSLFVHKRNCLCPLCTWNFKFVESSTTKWRGNVEISTYVFTPKPERPHQKQSLMVTMDWTCETLDVMPMLLMLSGDVETNPGPPPELTLRNLTLELRTLTDPLQFGIVLGLPSNIIEVVKKDNPSDTDGRKMALFSFIEKNHQSFDITWEKIADSLALINMGDLALELRVKCCIDSEQSMDTGQENPHQLISLSMHQSSSDDTLSSNSSVKQKYVRFVCGCGQCSVSDYTSGKHCPNPKQHPFPKVGLSDDIANDAVDIDIFEQILLSQARELHVKFADLITDTVENMQSAEIDIERVKNYLKVLFRPHWFFPRVSRTAIAGSLNDVNNFHELAVYLQENFCSWYNYDLLKRLRGKYLYTVTEDRQIIEYETEFEKYVSRRCFLYLDDVGPSPSNMIEVACKVNIEFATIPQELIAHLKFVFTKIIGLSKYHLTFKEAREGCTELVFRAPQYITNLTKLSVFQIRQLKEHEFLEIRIGRHCIFSRELQFTPREDILQEESHKLVSIKTAFSSFKGAIQSSFEKQGIPLESLRECILSLEVFTNKPMIKIFNEKDREELRAAGSLKEVMQMLNCFVTFFDYHIMAHLVCVFGSAADKHELEYYKVVLEQYCSNNSVYEFGFSGASKKIDEYITIIAKVTQCPTVQDVYDLQKKIADTMYIHLHAFRLYSIQLEGSVSLTFSILSARKDAQIYNQGTSSDTMCKPTDYVIHPSTPQWVIA